MEDLWVRVCRIKHLRKGVAVDCGISPSKRPTHAAAIRGSQPNSKPVSWIAHQKDADLSPIIAFWYCHHRFSRQIITECKAPGRVSIGICIVANLDPEIDPGAKSVCPFERTAG